MNEKPTTEELIAHVERGAKAEELKQSVLEQEFKIRARVAENKLKQYQENDKNAEIAKHIDYGHMSDMEIEKVQKDNTDYILAARNKMPFINEDFDGLIPMFQKNLIMIAGQTGDGKSTTVANIVRSIISDKNPKTGKRRRVLVITNEEATADVYNRITCLGMHWDYRNHDKFTDGELEIFNRSINVLAKSGALTVIDRNYGGSMNSTSTLEGICQIMESLIANKDNDPYDAIIIDYLQNIIFSRNMIGAEKWRILEAVTNKLNGYKDMYPAPILLMTQIRPRSKDDKTSFKERIEGCKSVLNDMTCAIEMAPDRENSLTRWHIHKNRFNGPTVGRVITTGYLKGEYVQITDEFTAMVDGWKEKAKLAAMNEDASDKMFGPSEPAEPAALLGEKEDE